MNLLSLNILKTKFLCFGRKKTNLSDYKTIKIHEDAFSIRICNCKQLIYRNFKISETYNR